MNASHVSLRDDYETSCPEVDVLVDEAWKIPGVIGSRITGGGFGGCTVSIVKDEAIDQFMKRRLERHLSFMLFQSETDLAVWHKISNMK